MGNLKYDLTGKTFGRLTVINRTKNIRKHRTTLWICKCECGNETIVSSAALLKGRSKSCGCLNKEILSVIKKSHGASNTKLYRVWNSMRERCTNPNVESYKRYGAIGIKLCSEWMLFDNFYKWALENGYEENKGLTIDRINSKGNYEPSNCRWASMKQQSNNRSSNHYVVYKGVQYTLAQLADKFNLNYDTLKRRIYYGWDIERAVETPVKGVKNEI